LNLNFSEFKTLKWVSAPITNNDTLILGWISAIELKYGSLHMVKVVTTKTLSNWIPDSTWREASIRLNVDIIEKTIAISLQRLYMNQGNTPTVRGSIKDKVISILNYFTWLNILVADENTNTPAFQTPLVTTDVLDSSKVNIDIWISPWKPLNFIQLNFKLSI
jgi:hypothetical protein